MSQVGLFGLVLGVGSGWEDRIGSGQLGSGGGVWSSRGVRYVCWVGSGQVRLGGWVGGSDSVGVVESAGRVGLGGSCWV